MTRKYESVPLYSWEVTVRSSKDRSTRVYVLSIPRYEEYSLARLATEQAWQHEPDHRGYRWQVIKISLVSEPEEEE